MVMEKAMEQKSYQLYYLKMFMSLINFIIIGYYSIVSIITVHHVNRTFSARNFLENLTYLPTEPVKNMVYVFMAFFLLLLIIDIREKEQMKKEIHLILFALELFLCLCIIRCLYVDYAGIALFVIADIVTSIKGKNNRAMFLAMMAGVYICSDYNIVSLFIRLPSFSEMISIYNNDMTILLTGTKNMLTSINLFVFIVYMIILMRNQMKEKARIELLNLQLQQANEQLKDYAKMQEKIGETRERNRIAREIHDTMGHTMTGISAGIDASLTMIDYSVEGTKKQLELISKVARQGIVDIRRSVNKLRPDALERIGLGESIEKLIQDTIRMAGVDIDYRCSIAKMSFNVDEEDTIYRIIQESITNAIRHGKASKISIEIKRKEKWLVILIRDNGIGCVNITKGFGLIHMKERVEMLHGEIQYNGSAGFQIGVKIPIRWGKNYD